MPFPPRGPGSRAAPDATIAAASRLAAVCGVLLAVSPLFPVAVAARNLIVPDAAPTIQAALDSIYPGMAPIDTVFVRAGNYHERVRGRMPILVVGIPDASGRRPEVDALSLWDEAGGMGTILFRDLRIRGHVSVTIAPEGSSSPDASWIPESPVSSIHRAR